MAASLVVRPFVRVPRNFTRFASKALPTVFLKRCLSLPEPSLCPYHQRYFSKTLYISNKQELPATEVKKLMESLTDKFSEARELMDDARESKGTVYFSEDMKEAQQAVEDTLTEYKNILEKLSDKQRQDVISTLGLRMEELKAQKMAMEEEIKHDD